MWRRERDSFANARGNYVRSDQMDRARASRNVAFPAATAANGPSRLAAAQTQAPPRGDGGDRNWSARIRASIARLLEIDGISLDPDTYGKTAEKRKAREAELAFHTRVDRLQAASECAHKEYWDRLRDVYSASTAKKMRLTTTKTTNAPPPTTIASDQQPRHEALDALAVAAATKQFTEPPQGPPSERKTSKKTKRGERRQSALHSEGDAGTSQKPVAVHDPALVKAVDKLTGKLTELLGQLQAISDAAAAEPILAAAASIALEATEMQRCEQVALTRMAETDEHRQQIMQGLLEYAQRKEKRDLLGDDGENGSDSPSNRDESAQATETKDADPEADKKQQ